MSAPAFPWQFVTPLYLATALNAVNTSLLATALVPIALAMHQSVGHTAVLVTALYLVSAVAQPTAGKVAEEYGARNVFLAGAGIVILGGLVGTFGQNLETLIASRVLIGIGTSAAGYPAALLMIRRRADQLGLAAPPGGVLGGIQIAGLATVALGLPLGGVLVDAWGWRTTFFANVPVALAALVMAVLYIAPSARVRAATSLREVANRIDVAGIFGFAAAMSALLMFLFGLPHFVWPLLTLSVVAGAGWIAWELRARHPFVDLRLLAANGPLCRTYLRWGLTTLCIYTVIYGVPQWLQSARALSARDTALLLLPMMIVAGLIMQPISRRNLGPPAQIAAGITSLLGSIGVLLMTSNVPIVWVAVISVIFGITVGTAASGNQLALYRQSAADKLGTATGLFRTFGYVGSIGSGAMVSVTFHTAITDAGLHIIGAIMIAVSVLVVAITLVDWQRFRTSSQSSSVANNSATSS